MTCLTFDTTAELLLLLSSRLELSQTIQTLAELRIQITRGLLELCVIFPAKPINFTDQRSLEHANHRCKSVLMILVRGN